MNSDAPATEWAQDILGPDFEQSVLPLGPDPDGEGEVVATLVRHRAESLPPDAPAILWIHGVTDYFFQRHVAEHFAATGFAFYALDLRKCGRSHRPGQSWHHVTDLALYDAELNRAVDIIRADHDRIVVMAHSTGGLIAPLWLNRLGRGHGAELDRHASIAALILDSPWFGMSMYPSALMAMATPAIHRIGRRFPRAVVPAGELTAYAESIHRDYHGEWDFDIAWKSLAGFPKRFSWLSTILDGHRSLHRGIDCGVPVLVLHSSGSWTRKPYSAATDTADAVLEVRDISRWAPGLGSDVTVEAIPGARHDVFLSLHHARERAFDACDTFLTAHQLP